MAFAGYPAARAAFTILTLLERSPAVMPNMAARTQRMARRSIPDSPAHCLAHCQAVDARSMPFRDGSFDAVVCCYLFELLSGDDILNTLLEIHRVLRRKA